MGISLSRRQKPLPSGRKYEDVVTGRSQRSRAGNNVTEVQRGMTSSSLDVQKRVLAFVTFSPSQQCYAPSYFISYNPQKAFLDQAETCYSKKR